MTRIVEYSSPVHIRDCIHCPYYDEVSASKDMRKLYLCCDSKSTKITENKSDLYIWFHDKCKFPPLGE